jgi:hypothetical protein
MIAKVIGMLAYRGHGDPELLFGATQASRPKS